MENSDHARLFSVIDTAGNEILAGNLANAFRLSIGLLQKDYFSRRPSDKQKLSYKRFTNIYFLGYYRAYRDAIRSIYQGLILFC
ncbi:glycosyl hydrolase [Penicillium longicatenatum]|nr:glycosyl hydrolase [Penicillium longicatenatum]